MGTRNKLEAAVKNTRVRSLIGDQKPQQEPEQRGNEIQEMAIPPVKEKIEPKKLKTVLEQQEGPEEPVKVPDAKIAEEPQVETVPIAATAVETEQQKAFLQFDWPLFFFEDPELEPVPPEYDKLGAFTFRLPISLDKTVDKHLERVRTNKSEWVRRAIKHALVLERAELKKRNLG